MITVWFGRYYQVRVGVSLYLARSVAFIYMLRNVCPGPGVCLSRCLSFCCSERKYTVYIYISVCHLRWNAVSHKPGSAGLIFHACACPCLHDFDHLPLKNVQRCKVVGSFTDDRAWCMHERSKKGPNASAKHTLSVSGITARTRDHLMNALLEVQLKVKWWNMNSLRRKKKENVVNREVLINRHVLT